MNWIKGVPFLGTVFSGVECVDAGLKGNYKKCFFKFVETAVDVAMDVALVSTGGFSETAKTYKKLGATTAVNTIG